MRQTFQTELRELQTQMAALGSLCADAIAKAVHAFLDDEQEVAASLSTLADTMDEKERDIENMCLRLLLKQQPVARDLRTISSALKMVTDMKRIGDQSADIAEIVRTAEPPAESRTKMYRTMALDVIHMVDESVDAFLQQDSARADAVIAYSPGRAEVSAAQVTSGSRARTLASSFRTKPVISQSNAGLGTP